MSGVGPGCAAPGHIASLSWVGVARPVPGSQVSGVNAPVALPWSRREDCQGLSVEPWGPKGWNVPLSEQEHRALEALERALYEQDPDFVYRLRATRLDELDRSERSARRSRL